MTLRHQSSGLRAIGLWFRGGAKSGCIITFGNSGDYYEASFLDPLGGLGYSSRVKKVIVLVAYR